jgi:membrane-associated phospholipid phosphatase
MLALVLCSNLAGVAGAQEATRPLFTWQDGLLAWGFVGATIAARPVDKHWAKRLQSPRAQESIALKRVSAVVRTIAAPGSLIIGTGMYASGRLMKNERLASLGLHGTEALLIGEGTAVLLKGVFGRERPYVSMPEPNPYNYQLWRGFKGDSKFTSFPSGHTVAGFAAAAAVTSETAGWWPGWRWGIGTVMYGGAALVGVSRMYENRHWASDVITGAAIGTFAGTKVVRYHNSHPNTSIDRWLLNVSVAPAEGGGHTLSMSVRPMRASTRLVRPPPR